MSGDIVVGIRLKGDASGLVGEVKIGRDALTGMAGSGEAVTKSLKGATEQGGLLATAIQRAGHYTAAAFAADKVIDFVASIKEATLEGNRLRQTYAFAFGGMTEGARNLDYVRGAASALGLDLTTASRAYGKLAAASVGTALEGEKTRSIFEAVSKASLVMGLSAEESNGALLAISQMMSKGTVQAEELRGQLGERIPGAFQIAARAMNTTTAGLGKMLEQGNVVASDFLPKFAAELERTLGDSAVRAADSLQASINRLDGAWQKFKQSLGGSGDTGGTVGAAANWLTRSLEDAAGQMDRVAKNGHGLLARMFVGLSTGQANLLGAIFGVNAGTGEGIARDNDWMGRQLREIERLKTANIAAQKSGNVYEQDSTWRDLQAAQQRYDESFRARNAKGFTLPDLKAAANATTADIQDSYVALYTSWSAELVKHNPVAAARQAIRDYEKKFAVLKNTNAAAFNEGLDPLQKKLTEAIKQVGAPRFALEAAGLDAEGSRLKAWYEEYRNTIRQALDESRTDYQGYWALVEAGERHLVEEQLRLAEKRQSAAGKRGDKPEVVKLQGEIDALNARLKTGISAETDRGLAGDLAKARSTGTNSKLDWETADTKTLAAAVAWRRESLSVLEQELATAREKVAADLRERQAQLDKNEALQKAPALLQEYRRAAEDQATNTLAGLEAEIRARRAANEEWLNGVKLATRDYAEDTANRAGQVRRAWSSTWKRAEDDLTTFLTTGKGSLRDFAQYAIAEFNRIAFVQPMIAKAAGATSGWLDRMFDTSSLGRMATPGTDGGFGGQFALGGVFGPSGLSRHVNTVVDRPTYFANGGALMGEKDWEAVMPLKRGPDGSLGVQLHGETAGGGVQLQYAPVFQIDARGAAPGTAAMLGRVVDAAVARSKNELMSELASGGAFAVATGRRRA